MENESDYEKKLQILRKAVDQGAKLETLHSMEEFQYVVGWIEAYQKVLRNKILKGDLIEMDARVEAHAKGGYKALSDLLEMIDNLPKKAAKARKAIKDIMDQEARERGDETEQQ